MVSDNVLVVAAHPDDEVLGCGGTIARFAQDGRSIFIAILGEGITSRSARREEADPAAVKALQNCSREASSLLGAKDLFLFNLPDNRFDTIPLLDIVKIIEGLIERTTPTTLLVQHGGDLNIDHVITYRAALTAARPMSGRPVRTIYAYEVPSSTDWAFQKFSPAFRPNFFVDISRTLPLKLQSMQLYAGELHEFPHPRALQALKANAKHWGAVVGVQAAEAFELIFDVR